MVIAYLGLGSNMGNPRGQIETAVKNLSQCGVVISRSPLYKTEPMGDMLQDWFLNCVVKIDTSLSPRQLLEDIHAIENAMGRVRTVKNGPRTIDIDILLYGDEVISENDLEIPHPRFHERRFVLIPITDIAPLVVHPIFKKTASDLLKEVSDHSDVAPTK
ncbi:2-amino-4-hydroxy-6-hydroxymethyldihydropteridine diphosphokinase [Patescibacteria group bacterium]|nr:2-amino-4-hydroxy-6-hydroxymethyldihydropteridine diphosphokinase [Patescibacteria group bacterium]